MHKQWLRYARYLPVDVVGVDVTDQIIQILTLTFAARPATHIIMGFLN